MSHVSFTSKLKNNLHYIAVALVVLIAIAGILGWILHSQLLVQLRNDFAPMVFNTSVLFLLISAAFFAERLQNKNLCRILNAFALVIATLTFAQYIFDVNFGIDTLLWKPFLDSGTAAPGRMALSTAVCFIFASLLGFAKQKRYITRFIKVSLATLILGFSSIGLVSYFLVFSAEYGWGSFSRMAAHTAFGFILFAFATLWQLYLNVRKESPRRSAVVPFYVLIVGILTSVLIWQMLVALDLERNRSVTAIRAENFKEELDGTLSRIDRTMSHMAYRFSMGAYAEDDRLWMIDARVYSEQFPGNFRIIRSDVNSIARWVYPPEGSGPLSILNQDISFRRQNAEKIDEVKKTHRSAITEIFGLKGGDDGFILIVPVIKQGLYDGVVTASFSAKVFFNRLLNAQGYNITVYEGDKKVFSTSDADPVFARDWTVRTKYQKYGLNWRIVVVPSLPMIRNHTSALPGVVLLFGMSVSTLLAVALQFYNRARESERQSHESAEWKSAILDSSSLLMVSLDKNMKIREMNRRAEELYGYKTEELAGIATPIIFHDPEEIALFRLKIQAELGETFDSPEGFVSCLLRSSFRSVSEWTMKKKDGGTFTGRLAVSEVHDEKGHIMGYLGVIEDVTEVLEKERLLKEQERLIQVTSRLASLGEMAAGIAHEINNPLTIINGHIGILRRQLHQQGLTENKDINKRIDTMDNTVQRIAKIIRGLRTYARESDDGDKEWTTVSSLIDDTLAFCHEKFRAEDVELDVSLESELEVFVRNYQISQVLLNLFNNAVDAVRDCEVRRVEVRAKRVDGGVEISVSDSGPGVPAHLREKIMQPFFTTKEVGQGMGLGLSISQGIVQSHDGKFSLEEGLPTTFKIWLPAYQRINS